MRKPGNCLPWKSSMMAFFYDWSNDTTEITGISLVRFPNQFADWSDFFFFNQAGFLSSISLVSFTKKAIQGHKVSRPSTNLSEWSQGHKVTRSQGRAPTYQSGHIPRVGVVAEVKKSGGLVQKSCKTDVMRIFLAFWRFDYRSPANKCHEKPF